jgi:hypothetical protein
MNKFMKSSVLVIPVIVVAVLVVGCSSGFASQPEAGAPPSSGSVSQVPTNGRVQSNDGGQVTIDIEWVQAANDSLVFNVAMNTHSVDLDQYDLGELAVLRDDMGNEYHPVSWDSAPGGHHRRGTLAFLLPDSLSQGKAKYVEMVIRDVAGIEERVLTWEL